MNRQIAAIYLKENYSDKIPNAKALEDEQPRVYNAVLEYTDFLPPSAIFTERCYLVENDISDRVKCSCGKIKKFKNYEEGYPDKCTTTCKG